MNLLLSLALFGGTLDLSQLAPGWHVAKWQHVAEQSSGVSPLSRLGQQKATFRRHGKGSQTCVSLTWKLLETKAATESISWFPTLTVLRVLACTFILAKVLLSFDQTRRSQSSRLIEPASSGMAPLFPTARTASQNWQETERTCLTWRVFGQRVQGSNETMNISIINQCTHLFTV